VVNVTGYKMFVMSQYDVILTFGEVCWHSAHIIPHALSFLVIAAYNVSL